MSYEIDIEKAKAHLEEEVRDLNDTAQMYLEQFSEVLTTAAEDFTLSADQLTRLLCVAAELCVQLTDQALEVTQREFEMEEAANERESDSGEAAGPAA